MKQIVSNLIRKKLIIIMTLVMLDKKTIFSHTTVIIKTNCVERSRHRTRP